jgi:hypothetical protein
MSLFSLLNGSSQASTASSGSTMSALLAKIEAQKAASGSTITSSPTTDGKSPTVNITVSAQRAAAEAADAKKDAKALVAELRKTFDQADKDGKTADMSRLSGRGLALVALNQDGGFSRGEVSAAKAELRGRDRASALALISGGELTSTTLITYNKQLLAERASMSAEERALRDVNPKLR